MKNSGLLGRFLKTALITTLAAVLIWFGLMYYLQRKGEAPEEPVSIETGYVYIGLVAPRSGPLEDLGDSMVRGAEMAVEEINGNLIRNRKVKLLVQDENEDLPEAQRLGADPRVKAIIGHVMESTLFDSLELYLRNEKPVLLPVLSGQDISRPGDGLFFRLMPSVEQQVKRLAEYAYSELAVRKSLVIHESQPTGLDQARVWSEVFDQRGEGVVETVVFPETPEALLALTEKAESFQPEAILVALQARPAIWVLQALERANLNPQYFGAYYLAVTDMVAFLNRRQMPMRISLPFAAEQAGPMARVWLNDFQRRYHRDPMWVAATTYDAVMLAGEALRQGGVDSLAASEFINRLNGPPEVYRGLAGAYYFHEEGRGVGPVYLVEPSSRLLSRVP